MTGTNLDKEAKLEMKAVVDARKSVSDRPGQCYMRIEHSGPYLT